MFYVLQFIVCCFICSIVDTATRTLMCAAGLPERPVRVVNKASGSALHNGRITMQRVTNMNNQVKAQITNVDVLKAVTTSPMVEGFKGYTKAWPTKHAGPVPSPEMFTVALLFGKNRKAGPEAGFVAMQLRPEGASVAELAAAFNSGPAHNHSRALSADNKGAGAHYFTRTKGNGRFWLQFTAKGQKAIERLLQGMNVEMAAGDVAAPTGTVKTKRAAKVRGDAKPTSEAPKPAKRRKAKKPAEQVSPELMQAVEAELAERGHELEQMPAEQQPAHPNQQSDGHQK